MLKRFFLDCWTFLVPYAVVVTVMVVLQVLGYDRLAMLVSNAGLLLVMLGNLFYIAVWHSRTRWPKTSAWGRLVNVLTFRR